MKQPMPFLRAIFFDIGDTLVFDDPPIADRLQQALEKKGILSDRQRFLQAYRRGEDYALSQYLQGIPWEDPAVLHGSSERIFCELELSPLSDAEWESLHKEFMRTTFTRYPHPEALSLLQELKSRGFLVGTISDWDKTLPETLQKAGLLDEFDILSISSVVGVTKPHRLLFEDALDKAQCAPKECLHVGDWYELDVAGAHSAGMNALLYDHAGRKPDADCGRFTTFNGMSKYLLELSQPAY